MIWGEIEDLSDSELVARLVQRGHANIEAEALVAEARDDNLLVQHAVAQALSR